MPHSSQINSPTKTRAHNCVNLPSPQVCIFIFLFLNFFFTENETNSFTVLHCKNLKESLGTYLRCQLVICGIAKTPIPWCMHSQCKYPERNG